MKKFYALEKKLAELGYLEEIPGSFPRFRKAPGVGVDHITLEVYNILTEQVKLLNMAQEAHEAAYGSNSIESGSDGEAKVLNFEGKR